MDISFYSILNTVTAAPLLVSHLQKLLLSVMLTVTDYRIAQGRFLVVNGIEHFYLPIATTHHEHRDINRIINNATGLWI